MDETKPRRSWFRFSLLTFLITVTAIGGWIGWNLHEVSQRERCINYLKDGGVQIQLYGDNEIRSPFRMAKFPSTLGLFGARPVRKIRLTSNQFALPDAKLIGERFPEAEVEFTDRNGTATDVQ